MLEQDERLGKYKAAIEWQSSLQAHGKLSIWLNGSFHLDNLSRKV